MRRVILESPFAGDVEANIAYAKKAVGDCLHRGEAPIASHLLFTQPGVLRDDVPSERTLGINAGWEWYEAPGTAAVFYLDRGMSGGMAGALGVAERNHNPVEFRFLDPVLAVAGVDPMLRPLWSPGAFAKASEGTVAEGATGRLEAALNRRAPTAGAPFAASVEGRLAAFYRTMGEAQAGAELWDAFLADHPHTRAATQLLTGR